MFYFLRFNINAPSKHYAQLEKMTLEQYAVSKYVENNWLTQILLHKLENLAITNGDLEHTKNILREKCLVGLLSESDASMYWFERFFGWQVSTPQDREYQLCHIMVDNSRYDHPEIEENSKAWLLLQEQNKYDMLLFEFIKTLFFIEQTNF